MGWLFICLFRALGLARVRNLAPTPRIIRGRVEIDAGTVEALFTNRLHVLRDYGRRVITPVVRDLTKHESTARLTPSASQLLVRHPRLLDARDCQELRELLDRYEVLRAVIDFRDRLQQIWEETSASHGRTLEHLRELCTETETNRIFELRRFARRLSAYTQAAGSA